MLRNRSRAVTGKQALMADHTSQSSSSQNYTKPIPSFFCCQRFRAFAVMGLPETDQYSLISPTSVLDSKPFSHLGYQFSRDGKQPTSPRTIFSATKHSRDHNSQTKPVGLALIEDKTDSKLSKRVLFSSKLRVQIPPFPPTSTVSSTGSPKSPADLGAKSRNSSQESKSPQIVSGFVSVSEMKHSEEYTCIRTRGPNPKTTHIFDNCVVKSFKSPSMAAGKSFLSFCHTCRKNLEQANDIYIYRGEKAFCSHECRHQEMVLDAEMEDF